MTIARLLHALFAEAKASHESLHFVERQCGMERLRKELPLLGIRTGGVSSNEVLKVFECIWPKQIAYEYLPAWGTNSNDLREAIERLRDVVDDAVRDDGGETCVRVFEIAAIREFDANAITVPCVANVFTGDCQHFLGEIDRDDLYVRRLFRELDRYACGAGSDIENRSRDVWERQQKIRDEHLVHRGVVHRIVIAGVFGRVHHFRFENSKQHRELPIIAAFEFEPTLC